MITVIDIYGITGTLKKMVLNYLKYLCVLFMFMNLGCSRMADSCEGQDCEPQLETENSEDESALNVTPDSTSPPTSVSPSTDTSGALNPTSSPVSVSDNTLNPESSPVSDTASPETFSMEDYFTITNKLPSAHDYHIEIRKAEGAQSIELPNGECVKVHKSLHENSVVVVVVYDDQKVYEVCRPPLANQGIFHLPNREGNLYYACEHSGFGAGSVLNYKIESLYNVTVDEGGVPGQCTFILHP